MAYYNPYAASAQNSSGIDRLVQLMEARRQREELKKEQARLEAEANRQVQAQQQGALNNAGSMWGTAAKGAAMGAGFGALAGPGAPVGMLGGALIGGGAGLVLGGLSEMKKRKDLNKAMGNKRYNYWDSLKDTTVRPPTIDELGSIVGAGGSVAMTAAAANRANSMGTGAQEQAQLDWNNKVASAGMDPSNPYQSQFNPAAGQSYVPLKDKMNTGFNPYNDLGYGAG